MATIIATQRTPHRKSKPLLSTRLLLVVDDTPASERALAYVSDVLQGRHGFRVILTCLLPPMPAQLLEFGGAENPDVEGELEQELRHEQQRFISWAKEEARGMMSRMKAKFRSAGVASNSILTRFSDPLYQQGAPEELLEMARRYRCRTIVLGHQAHSWFREIVQSDLTEHLIRRGEGITFWIVE